VIRRLPEAARKPVTQLLAVLVAATATVLALAPARAESNVPAAATQFDLERPEIRSFLDEVAKRHSLQRGQLEKLLKTARPQPRIIELISRPAERVVPWWEYRERFLTEDRIALGVKFWEQHRESLEKIAMEHGVAPEYIVAIIGVETKYGAITGRFRVLDALATLAFDYPPRSAFFRKELEEFVLLTQEESLKPDTALGSYAGAMGGSQFMPSSYRRFAVDADGDGKRDLWASWNDVFASTANYFREHGWQTGAPVLSEVELDPEPTFTLDTRNLKPNETVGSLAAQGLRTKTMLPPETPALIISAEQKDGPAYRVGFHNFEVITKYNRSVKYAMTVNDLAEAIAQRVRGGQR
jgi:membrane-bound lytic murein transglycosylase B